MTRIKKKTKEIKNKKETRLTKINDKIKATQTKNKEKTKKEKKKTDQDQG